MEEPSKLPRVSLNHLLILKAMEHWGGVRIESASGSAGVDYTPYDLPEVYVFVSYGDEGEWHIVTALPRPDDERMEEVVNLVSHLFTIASSTKTDPANIFPLLVSLLHCYSIESYKLELTGNRYGESLVLKAPLARERRKKLGDCFKYDLPLKFDEVKSKLRRGEKGGETWK
ncbi:MAG: hypothetical protein QXF87_07655 [Thermofilaceae archaeon]